MPHSYPRYAAFALAIVAGTAHAGSLSPRPHRGIGSLANTNVQTVIGLPDQEGTVIDASGSLTFTQGRVRFGLGAPERFGADIAPRQRVYEGDLPMTETRLRAGDLICALLAFREPERSTDMVRATLRNTGSRPTDARLLVQFEELPGEVNVRGDQVVVSGSGPEPQVVGSVTPPDSEQREAAPWGCTTPAATPSPGWAHPNAPCDPAFANIRVGWGGVPIGYDFRVDAGGAYVVYVGLCESWWGEAGRRILDVTAEGADMQTVDPVAAHGQHVPFVLRFDASDADRNARLTVSCVSNPSARDQNAILNAIWVFRAGQAPAEAEMLSGRADPQALYYVDVGGGRDRLYGGRIGLVYQQPLGPGEARTIWLRLKPQPAAGEPLPPVSPEDGERLLAATERYWRNLYDTLVQIRVPDPVVTDLYKMSVADLLITRDRVDDFYIVKPGETIYDAFWYRDGSYMVLAFDCVGRHDLAEQSLRLFWRDDLPSEIAGFGQEANGAWDCPRGEWDGQGQALWALWRHYALTGDEQWLRQAYPAIRRGARWIADVRNQTKRPEDEGKPHYGLLPQGSGEAIIDGYVYYHNFWAVAGLKWAANAARALGETGDAEWMDREREDFARCLRSSVEGAFRGVGAGRSIPADPYHANARIWGDLAAVWPGDFLPPHDPMVDATWGLMEDRSAEGMYEFVTNPKIWPYMSCDWAQTYLLRDEPDKAREVFLSHIDHAAATRGWIEEIFLDSRVGTGDMPHCWAAADYLLLLRSLLANDSDGKLTLLEGIPDDWLAGEGLSVRGAPTMFGPISLTARGSAATGSLDITIDPPDDARHVTIALPSFARRGRLVVNGRLDRALAGDGYAAIAVPQRGEQLAIAVEPR
jgi:hypothetical protein